MQKTKMIFTIGPSSEKESTLRELIKIGMNVWRIAYETEKSHGSVASFGALPLFGLLRKQRRAVHCLRGLCEGRSGQCAE